MTPRRAQGQFDDAWLEVDKRDDPGFFVRFLDASRSRALEFTRLFSDGVRSGLVVRSFAAFSFYTVTGKRPT